MQDVFIRLARARADLIRKSRESEHAGFQSAIQADPDEETNWLAYADYLQDNGMEPQANRVRWWVGARRHTLDATAPIAEGWTETNGRNTVMKRVRVPAGERASGGPATRTVSVSRNPEWAYRLLNSELVHQANRLREGHAVLGQGLLHEWSKRRAWASTWAALGLGPEVSQSHEDMTRLQELRSAEPAARQHVHKAAEMLGEATPRRDHSALTKTIIEMGSWGLNSTGVPIPVRGEGEIPFRSPGNRMADRFADHVTSNPPPAE